MKRNYSTEFRVGLFVGIAILIGGSITFVLGNQRNLFQSKAPYRAVFSDVGGLRPGTPVRIAGVEVGLVSSVDLASSGKIEVSLEIVERARNLVREGGVASIGQKGMLGDRLVDISVGRGRVLPEGSTIPSEESVDLSQYMIKAGRILAEVEGIAANLHAATEPLGEAAFASDLRATTHHLAGITRMLSEGDGTIQRLMTDRDMAANIDNTLANIRTASQEVASMSRNVNAIANEVRSGDGTAHDLIYGEDGSRLANNLADATGELATLMRDVRTSDGTIHDLIYEDDADQLIDNLTAMSGDLRAITADVRAGRGTLGGLITDPSIYEDVKRLVGDLERNEILRALVRYSIRQDESSPAPRVKASGD